MFLACAHTHSAPLPELVEEIRDLEKILSPLKERGLYEMLSNRAANIDDIFNTFSKEKDIQLFHYAGHADGETLYLEEAGSIKGITELFGLNKAPDGRWNPLQLVFLNGCATLGQVKSLHAAGIAAVIATSRKIGDEAARIFSRQFYQTLTMEGKTITDAFDAATARVHTLPQAADRGIARREELPAQGGYNDAVPWGLYFHPELPEDHPVRQWTLNRRPELPDMLLAEVKPHATQSLRVLVHEFRKTDKEAQQLIRNERKDPLMVLIERLPWIIGTHLRRLFAVEAGRTMTEPGVERLRELIAAYTELTRFVSYLCLSMLWDANEEGLSIEPMPFPVIPDKSDFTKTDFIFRTRTCLEQLERLDNSDPLNLVPHIAAFLQEVDQENGLRPGYLLMEEWKQAQAEGKERLEELVQSRATEKPEGVKGLVLEAEAVYARFLKAALFLTQYKLHTVRSIVVDKIRNLNAERPYSHYTISLHAAFSQLQTATTPLETATDNYCLLLTARGQQEDTLTSAINLSPFYIDRSSFIGKNTGNYPSVFALDYCEGDDFDKKYVFHYIDTDINHQYAFEQDNELVIDPYGAVLPEHLEVEPATAERFERIYEQLQQLESDLPGKEGGGEEP